MHINEWIKKYSPINEIYKAVHVARLLDMPHNNMKYALEVQGKVLADQKKPKLVESE